MSRIDGSMFWLVSSARTSEREEMKRINFPLMAGIGYISLFVGICAAKTGEFTKPVQYVWYDPFWIGLCIALPLVLGWMAHEEHIKN